MPKVELHVHIEGSIPPATLLELARRNKVELPAKTEAEVRDWYVFTDFPHFADVYQTVSRCVQTAEDIELLVYDFLKGQAKQNILHSEATYTASTHYKNNGLSFTDQLAAINRARSAAMADFGVSLLMIIDIPREFASDEEAMMVADWAVQGHGNGVAALGLGGYEVGFPPERFAPAFARARDAGVPAVVHAGETEGPASILGALDALKACRIGHGVRCLEDAGLVERLRDENIPLEVCPGSNVSLGVVPDLESHPLPTMIDAGLNVSINTDDPPFFNTNLVMEYQRVADTFGYGAKQFEGFVLGAVEASLLDTTAKQELRSRILAGFKPASIA